MLAVGQKLSSVAVVFLILGYFVLVIKIEVDINSIKRIEETRYKTTLKKRNERIPPIIYKLKYLPEKFIRINFNDIFERALNTTGCL